MPHVLSLESIGDTHIQAKRMMDQGKIPMTPNKYLKACKLGGRKRPWCAKIKGISDDGRPDREFVEGLKSYQEANGTGSRGVKYWFVLRDGVYEIFEHCTWNRTHRYFAVVEGDTLREITKEELLPCLSKFR